jgi:hypothetical protein
MSDKCKFRQNLVLPCLSTKGNTSRLNDIAAITTTTTTTTTTTVTIPTAAVSYLGKCKKQLKNRLYAFSVNPLQTILLLT